MLADNRRELSRIRQEIRTRTGDERARRAELMQMQANQQVMTEELADLDKKIDLYRDVAMKESRQGVQSAEFLSALQSLENERDDLQRLIEQTYQDLPAIVSAT